MTLVKSTGNKKVNLDFNKEFINTFSDKIQSSDIKFINQTLKDLHDADVLWRRLPQDLCLLGARADTAKRRAHLPASTRRGAGEHVGHPAADKPLAVLESARAPLQLTAIHSADACTEPQRPHDQRTVNTARGEISIITTARLCSARTRDTVHTPRHS